MTSLASLLTPVTLKLDQLLLDPNNPRFSELGEELNSIPEARFADEKVQSKTREQMKSSVFDVSELKDTIKAVGFLPMDRIVVRKWRGKPDITDKFVVIEGNRRICALKWLIELHENGKETFSDDQLNNFTNLECLELDDQKAPESATLILPGLRHVSGIKEWGAYQKAKAVYSLRRSGLSPQEAAQSLGLSTRAANTAYICYLALEQMKADEAYGEHATPRLYSYFEETFKRPDVKDWLDWNKDEGKFKNYEHLTEFYSWIVPPPEGGESPKLPEAKSIRDLGRIIKDEIAFSRFRATDGTLAHALAAYEAEHPEDWFPRILAASNAIKSLTPEMLRKMYGDPLNALSELQQRVGQALKDREVLIKHN